LASDGHVALVPEHVSAGSHTPVDDRQIAVAERFVHALVLTVGWQDWQLLGAVFR
jgi:hypothetical protein